MLDLSKEKKFYQIKWFDEKVYNIPLPSQEMLMGMDNILELINSDKNEDHLEGTMEFVKYIMSLNKEKHKFKEADFKDLDVDLINLIITDYKDFTDKILGE